MSTTTPAIPGYTYGQADTARSPLTLEELRQLQSPRQLQPQPRAAERPRILHPHPRCIHLHPLRPNVVEQPLLSPTPATLGNVLHTQAPLFVELPQVGHHPLPRTTPRAKRLAQCPVGMPLAVLRR